MDCAGCESKIKKTLQKLKGILRSFIILVVYKCLKIMEFCMYVYSGVDSIEIDMATQKVTVTGWADQKKVLKAVRKTGRRAELWSLPYNPEHHNGTDYFNISQHHCNGPLTHFTPQPSSHYNYYKHGYDSHDGSYYHRPPQSTIFGEQTGAAFSDDNPNACSIM